ncbi:MAG: hypothetical protein KC996_04555 [Phycisphaerales bacterium]|nr:hypothetical protein [Phycisphaerales bacterium]
MQPTTNNNRSTPAQLRSKLGTYLTGVAIGFILLGAIYYQKHRATQRYNAEKAAQQSGMETANDQPATPATESTP